MKPRKQGRTGRRHSPAPAQIDVQIDDSCWRQLGPRLAAQIKLATRVALGRAGAGNGKSGGLTVLLTGNDRVRALNRQYRGKDKPTNVLSFPSHATGYLGDIAIAYGVTSHEADSAGVALQDHLLHLAVHGVLHLLGYDHEAAAEGRVMEALEAEILAEMDIPNPHARRGRAA
jgi:probable rRNA maturation factor